MRALGLALILTFVANLAGAEEPPLQEPQLRIEAGMHTAIINRIDVSQDGQLLVTGSDDKTVRLWSLPDGRLLKTFRVPIGPGNDGKVFAVALSPDGRLIAAGGWMNTKGDEYIYLFDTLSGALTRLGPVPGNVKDIAFSANAERLAAGLGTNGVRVWTAPFIGEPKADNDYGGGVYGLAFDRSGSERLATTSEDGHLRLYDGELTLPPKKVKAPGGEPYDVDFSPDGGMLAVGYADTTKVHLLRVPDLSLIHEVETGFADSGNLGRVAWSADGTALYAGGKYGDDTGVNPVIRWLQSGFGAPEALGGSLNTIMDLAARADREATFGSADPALGLFGSDGKFRKLPDSQGGQQDYRGSVTADMRNKLRSHFRIAEDSSAVWFGLKRGSEEPWRFDVAKLAFEAASEGPADYIEPVTNKLKIENWEDETQPTLDGQALALRTYERSRSLAISPDAKSFVLGTEWWIRRFDSNGKEAWKIPASGVAWGVNLSADGSIVVAALADGTIRWYRASDGTELLAFFVHVPDKRWIAWTPSGYYTASPGAEDLIGWHVNGKTWDSPVDFFPASRFRDRFYRPDIVQLVLKLRDEQRTIREANIRAKRKMEEESIAKILPAVVEIVADPRGIATDNPELMLTYRLRSPSARAITKLEARVDDRPIESRAAVSLEDQDEHDITISLPPRDAEVSLIAWIGDQPSAPAKLQVKWTGLAAPKKPKLYALLIGVSEYDDSSLKLGFAAKDARDLMAALEGQKGRQYSDVEIVPLLDKDASRRTVLTELAKLQGKAGPEDFVIVFMAGHGLTDDALDFYYLPSDGSPDPLLLEATTVSGLVINNMLSKIKGKVLLFMDTCRSGGAASARGRVDMGKAANDMAQGGLVVLASSTGRQDSLESAEWNNGAFTYAMLQTFNDANAYGEDGALDIYELAGEISKRVSKLTEGRQMPVMANYGPLFTLASLR